MPAVTTTSWLPRLRKGVRSLNVLWLLARVAWLIALASHSVWFVKGIVSGGGISLPLGLSLCFFALKVWDVPFLRVTWSRRSVIAAIVVVLFLHANVITDAAADADWTFLWSSFELPFGLTLKFVLVAVVAAAGFVSLGRLGRFAKIRGPDPSVALTQLTHPMLQVALVRNSPLRAPPV